MFKVIIPIITSGQGIWKLCTYPMSSYWAVDVHEDNVQIVGDINPWLDIYIPDWIYKSCAGYINPWLDI